MMKELNFTVFADMHYKKMMYCTTVGDMEAIIERAKQNESDFMIHEGDFCNDYKGSPEISNAYLKNTQGINAYGIYGNHELEGENDDMKLVTPMLTNDNNVVWGTDNSEIGDGFIGYYYFDINGYRNICVDANYSYNPTSEKWEHSITYCPPQNNIKTYSLGPVQLEWLERVLVDAAYKGVTCIVHSHPALCSEWKSCVACDSDEVRKIFNRVNSIHPRTVIMQLSGHAHINRMEVIENVFYMSVNTVVNGLWRERRTEHYSENIYPFNFEEYDEAGLLMKVKTINISDLTMSKNTFYFNSPLSADIKIENDNKIIVKGTETSWRFGIAPKPEDAIEFMDTKISDAIIELC